MRCLQPLSTAISAMTYPTDSATEGNSQTDEEGEDGIKDPSHPELPTTGVDRPDAEPESLESSCVPGPSGIKKTADSDLAGPESTSLLQDPSSIDGTPVKRKVCTFLKKVWKAARCPCLCCDPVRVQPLTPHPQLPEVDDSESVPVRDVPNPEPEPVPEPEPEPEPGPKPEPEQVGLPVQVSEDPRVLPESQLSSSEPGHANRFAESYFEVRQMIGEGSYGRVFEAYLMTKNEILKVALKEIRKHSFNYYIKVEGYPNPLFSEVAMLLILGKPPKCPYIIQLHHWTENRGHWLLFMELPNQCDTLKTYIRFSEKINEQQARWFINQLLRAIKFCVERGVFHGDLHSSNILVTKPSLHLKLIDFGCSRLISSEPFKSSKYRGAILYRPPEIFNCTTFYAKPVYVWAIGVLLFKILHRYLPFHHKCYITEACFFMDQNLSDECHDLIKGCLTSDPVDRLELHQLDKHRWFSSQEPQSRATEDKKDMTRPEDSGAAKK